ncbi:hypothetical protein ACLM45_13570 [Synechococcus sp. A10-1-5-9]|uniref:hypothetical protein n=1 Tax=Synechococcus sp. A10-1-5-9 TaxID=3392295 RepID=UPI0039EB1B69
MNAELNNIAGLLAKEADLIQAMSQDGAPAKQESVAECYSGGVSQLALLTGLLQLECL